MRNVIITFAFIFSSLSMRAQNFKIYYLVIGSSHYEHNSSKFKEENFIPFDDLPEANASAKVISNIFKTYGNGKGITLSSSENEPITKDKVFKCLDTLGKMINVDSIINPLLVIYYCGHGISENLGWNQFLIPGDYSSFPGNKKIDELEKDLIYIGDITDKLSSINSRYIFLIDCCRKEEADNSLPEAQLDYFFDKQNVETFKTIVAGLKYLNEYHQINPVIFSIAPGNVAFTVDLPKNEIVSTLYMDTSTQVGPICRRVVCSISKLKSKENLSFGNFVRDLTDATLDSVSSTSVSFYEVQNDSTKNQSILCR